MQFWFLCSVAPLLGFCTNFYQEHLYKKYFPTKGPEARLFLAMVAGVILPSAMFIYAWTSFPRIHWIAPIIGITVSLPLYYGSIHFSFDTFQTFIWGIFMIYTAVFSYLADWYVKSDLGGILSLPTRNKQLRALRFFWSKFGSWVDSALLCHICRGLTDSCMET